MTLHHNKRHEQDTRVESTRNVMQCNAWQWYIDYIGHVHSEERSGEDRRGHVREQYAWNNGDQDIKNHAPSYLCFESKFWVEKF